MSYPDEMPERKPFEVLNSDEDAFRETFEFAKLAKDLANALFLLNEPCLIVYVEYKAKFKKAFEDFLER